jgi:ABC-type sugar transport system ATPase subunit
MTAILELVDVSKSFAGVRALQDVSFDVRPGEVHALLGENGAGKSTLIRIIAGVHAPDAGEMRLAGAPVRFGSPRAAREAGIATVYQELLLFPELTVAENIFLGNEPKLAWGGIDWRTLRREARALLDRLDSHDLDIDANISHLSVANRQRVEIAKALSREARVLVMDEPTAALADADVRRLMDVVRRLRERGVGIVYVSHKLPEIFALADRVTVLRDGGYVGTIPIAQASEQTLVSMMVGRSIDRLFPKETVPIGATVLELSHVGHLDEVHDISFSLRAGEILGIAGLIGSGRTETALTIFGITPATRGEIRLDGKPVTIGSPAAARALGIAYIPEDRGQQGLIRSQTIRENIALASLDDLVDGLVVNGARETALAKQFIELLGVRSRGPEQPVRQLSGGNQQKVVLGKWLATKPRILIMDEPTRGIDVGAKAEIHALMGRLAGEGLAILMISSELPEVLGMSDRVLVMSEGRIVAEFDRARASAEVVGAAMTGTRAAEVA